MTCTGEAGRNRALWRAGELARSSESYAVVIQSGPEYHAALEDDLYDLWAGATEVARFGPDGELERD